MKNKCVCFSGHRWHKFTDEGARVALTKLLAQEIELCIEKGYDTFFSGMAEGFDMLAAKSVIALQATYPHIALIAVVPCHDWRSFDDEEKAIFAKAQKTIAAAEKPGKKAYHARNRYLVEQASLLVCYYNGAPGGTKYTMQYAKTQKLEIINLFQVSEKV